MGFGHARGARHTVAVDARWQHQALHLHGGGGIERGSHQDGMKVVRRIGQPDGVDNRVDAAGGNALAGQLLEGPGVVLFRSRRVERSPFVDDRLQARGIVEIHLRTGDFEIEIIAVAKHQKSGAGAIGHIIHDDYREERCCYRSTTQKATFP